MDNPTIVNGKKVYSDKKLHSINGTRIIFSDRSWCDVESGQVVNNGPGYINIGSPSEETGGNETREESFTAYALDISNISANVDIQVTDGDKITVKAKGSVSTIKDIDLFEREGTVFIEGKCSNTGAISVVSRGSSIVIGGGCSGNIITSGGSISVGGCHISGSNISIGSKSGFESDTKITISVPRKTSVVVSKICGQVDIGDTEGSLQASISGDGKINAGCVKDAMLNVRGSGDIDVQEVNGNLTVQIAGSGDVRVRQGKVSMLNVNITGSGDAKYGGEAENANLNIVGSGDINVAFVKNRPNKNIVGHGDINIGNW